MSIRDGANSQDGDPFASRVGKALSWANVNMAVHQVSSKYTLEVFTLYGDWFASHAASPLLGIFRLLGQEREKGGPIEADTDKCFWKSPEKEYVGDTWSEVRVRMGKRRH